MKYNEALLIIDCQYDFMPGGSLAITNGDEIVPVINNLLPNYDLVIFTKDWHAQDNQYFAENHIGKKPFDQIELNGKIDTLWPAHCVQGTHGAKIHKDINFELMKKDAGFYIFKKGIDSNYHPYSGFGNFEEDSGLNEFLSRKNIVSVDICGLALDFCCKDTAIDAVDNGFITDIILNGTRAIDPNFDTTIFRDNNIFLK